MEKTIEAVNVAVGSMRIDYIAHGISEKELFEEFQDFMILRGNMNLLNAQRREVDIEVMNVEFIQE
ncbi:hypothetical protein QT711_03240 [Sporosarcina saromensis]|uniref:Uncharacterized protein n=1 Tax=Sporosarcina saromensis TaxID=359365 RepID=A0ABU4G5E6_9BACL|nr:hypothetical protein [Sporosarcina saromensis]MDW0112185.1 hypothetical protein [Sporosarcina saromensis]